ncbi:PilZ domain-containing protein [Thermodesulfobacteriota bacterium]
MGEIMENKRAYERFDLSVTVQLGVLGSGQVMKDDEVSLTTSNICAGGAFFVMDDPLPEGTRLKMDFIISIDKLKEMLDSHCRIKVEGEVVRMETSGIAVRFEEDYEINPVKGTLH